MEAFHRLPQYSTTFLQHLPNRSETSERANKNRAAFIKSFIFLSSSSCKVRVCVRTTRIPSLSLVVILDDSGLLADVETVEELSDILVLDGGGLLDEGRRLGHGLDGVAVHDQLVLK